MTARPPSGQWWTINGDCIMRALHQAHEGTRPDIVYLELIANSDHTDYGKETSHD